MQALFEKLVKISLHRKLNKLTSEHLQLRALQLRSQLVLLGLKHVTWENAHHPAFQDETIQRTRTTTELKEKTTNNNKTHKTNNKNHERNKNPTNH